MDDNSLKTERLTLRAPIASDADMITRALSDFGVTKWLAQVPFPYSDGMAQDWLARSENRWPELAMVTHNDVAIGCVDTKGGSIGYWLARDAWGQGFMTEAATAMRDHFFQNSDASVLNSGYFKGNAASEGVLRKMGFDATEETTMYNVAQAKDLPHINMALSRATWEASQ